MSRSSLDKLVQEFAPQKRVLWEYTSNFHCRNLRLLVESNEPGPLVRELGKGILNSEACGK
jgi:hypothetical protein